MNTLIADVDRINEVRIKRGWTMKLLAKKANRSSSAVYSTLRGQSQGPRMIKALCDALGLSTEVVWKDGKQS